MRLIRVFPRRTRATPTDALAYCGPPDLFAEADEVHVSVTFTYDKPRAEHLAEQFELPPPATLPAEQQKLVAQQKANRIDALKTMASFSQALAAYDRKDYENALKLMVPVMRASPNSMLVNVAYSEMKRRATTAAADKAKDQVKAGIKGLIKRPPE